MTRTFKDDLERNLRDPDFAKRFGAARAKSNFAITLAEARRQLNLTQQQLATKLGVSQSYIAKLEGGEANPTLDTIGSLLAIMELSLTTNTVPLSPYTETLTWADKWVSDPSLISPSPGAPFMTGATEGIGSGYIKIEREPVKIA